MVERQRDMQLADELKDYLERLGRAVEIQGSNVLARHRTALLEEETKFRVIEGPRDRPLKAKNTINVLAPWVERPDPDEYPRTHYFEEFLDRTIQAESLARAVIQDGRVQQQAAAFIPQHLSQHGQRLAETSLEYVFKTWLPNQDRRLLAVLAPAGYGKTVLTCAIADRLATNYLDHGNSRDRPPFPYLINFGEFRRLSSFEAMILTSLERHRITDFHSNAFAYLVARQRAVLILDGFDELLDERPEEARKNLRELIETLEGRGKVMITARSTFFRTSDDVADFLEYYLDSDQVSVVDLEPFDSQQRRELVARHTPDRTQFNRIIRFVDAPGLREPMGSPLLLKETVDALSEEGDGRLDSAAGRKDLFAALERSVYQRERTRKHHGFRDDVHRAFLGNLAKEMLEANVREFDWELVQVAASEAASSCGQDSDQAELDRFADHHFLHVEDGSKEVRFNHQVFREYFQARAMVEAVQRGEIAWITAVLNQRPLPNEVAGFLKEVDENRVIAQGLLTVVESDDRPSERLTKNLGAVITQYGEPELVRRYLEQLPPSIPIDMQIRGLDLSETDWSGRLIYRLDVMDCDLSDARFSGAQISDLTLLRTKVEGADFTNAVVESLSPAYGERVFGRVEPLRHLQSAGAICGLDPEATVEDLESQHRRDIIEQVRARLYRFYLPASGPNPSGSRWDSSIKEMNLLGGVHPSDRRFVKSKVIPALLTEGVLDRRRAYGDVLYDLRNEAEDDARALIEADELVGSVERAVERLMGRS